MNAIQLNPLVEARRFFAGCIRALRGKSDVDPELMIDAASQINEEAIQERLAHDREIVKRIEKAQSPDSPGGRAITPSEAEPIQRLANESITELT